MIYTLRKLWQEIRDSECKTAVNRVSKSIRPMTPKKALDRWETTLANTEATPLAIGSIAKSLIGKDGPRAPTAVHGPLGIKCHPLEKANGNADCLDKQFSEENHERRVEARVQALLKAVHNDSSCETLRAFLCINKTMVTQNSSSMPVTKGMCNLHHVYI
jgi:hypothetical protein